MEHSEVVDQRRLLYLHRKPVYHRAERDILIRSPSLRGVVGEAPCACKEMSAAVDVSDDAGHA